MKLLPVLVIFGIALVFVPENCDADCICISDYSPVCGSDGKVYSNGCKLECAKKSNSKLVKVKDGECGGSAPGGSSENDSPRIKRKAKPRKKKGGFRQGCGAACTMKYEPVCGTDGETYSNECALDIAICESFGGFAKASDGPCPEGPEPKSQLCSCSCPTNMNSDNFRKMVQGGGSQRKPSGKGKGNKRRGKGYGAAEMDADASMDNDMDMYMEDQLEMEE